MSWLSRTVGERFVTEFEAAEQLEKFRAENPLYRGPSMPLMSASGPSGAQPHYVPKRETSRRLNEHPLFWLDSGGHYPGGTTDNTFRLLWAHQSLDMYWRTPASSRDSLRCRQRVFPQVLLP